MNGDRFGFQVAIASSGSAILVSAIDDSVGSVGCQGSAYIFRRNGSGYGNWNPSTSRWNETQKISASDGEQNSNFGRTVALSGDGTVALVSSYKRAGFPGANQGAAYIFRWSGTEYGIWNNTTSLYDENQRIIAPDAAAGDYFGYSAAISSDGTTVLVSSLMDTINGNYGQGSLYLYRLRGSNFGTWNSTTNCWDEDYKIYASDGAADDHYGYSVTVNADGSVFAVSAPGDDVTGNIDQGSVYVY